MQNDALHAAFYYLVTSQGLLLEIIGPTLPDLKDLVGVNYEEISRALVAKSAGLFVGAFIGGILHERFYRYVL